MARAENPDHGAAREMTMSFTVRLEDGVDRDQLADAVAEALRPLSERAVNVSDLAVRTVPRGPGGPSAGYDSRLWEKATCKEAGDPRDRLVNPEVQVERVLQEAHELRANAARLEKAVDALSHRLGEG
jgi:hypothetical protein